MNRARVFILIGYFGRLGKCFHQKCISHISILPYHPLKLSKCSNNFCPIENKIVQRTCYVSWHSIAYGETAIIFPICHCLSIAYTCVFAQCMAMLLAATMLHCVNKYFDLGPLSLFRSLLAWHIFLFIYVEKRNNVALWYIFSVFIFFLFRSAVM